ncbi:IclR family transcriptional regulator [Microbacterium lushaniae]|uniref:Glycerol operon regulatory protein n=1 Tax=Microbacterium lushaniae TaxID=2614639 RepID=A0A5J6L1X4_9MICO|nr:helix-turn-helix domain-containing protein [Microbacterium lushaniae]QEW02392.1 helix-turn-helix domain-containing protein [Microbacterium lushaniae]
MPASPPAAPPSQTLSRGVRILEALAEAPAALTTDEIAREIAVHRSIAYRLIRTLEEHGLVERDETGRVALGVRLSALAAGVSRDLVSAALPELTAVANELRMTAFVGVIDGSECVTLTSVESRTAVASMAQRPGAHHPVSAGATGKALLSMLPESEWPVPATPALAAEVGAIRERGYAVSSDEVIPTVRAVAVPVRLRGGRPVALAVIYVGEVADTAAIARRLQRSADALRAATGG